MQELGQADKDLSLSCACSKWDSVWLRDTHLFNRSFHIVSFTQKVKQIYTKAAARCLIVDLLLRYDETDFFFWFLTLFCAATKVFVWKLIKNGTIWKVGWVAGCSDNSEHTTCDSSFHVSLHISPSWCSGVAQFLSRWRANKGTRIAECWDKIPGFCLKLRHFFFFFGL